MIRFQHTYTDGQNVLKRTLLSFLGQTEETSLAIIGYAGTGKTTVVIDCLWEEVKRYKIAFVAPTNKATKVMRDVIHDSGMNTPLTVVCTLHSLLGIRPNAQSELKLFSQSGKLTDLSEYKMIVVDEASMLSDDLLEVIEVYKARFPRVLWVFMGDPQQLRPVKQPYRSRIFTETPRKVLLTDIVRQVSGTPTAKLSTQVRAWAEEDKPFKMYDILGEAGQGEVLILNPREWRNKLLEFVTDEQYTLSSNFCRAVAWRNATVAGINDMVRAELYPGLNEPFAVGEKVLTAAPIKEKGADPEFVAFTDDEFTVCEVIIRKDPYYGIEVRDLQMEDSDGFMVQALVPTAMGLRDLNNELTRLSSQAKKGARHLWGTFWSMKEFFDDIRPCHALTSHRAQGSTYQTSFVNAADILANPNREESMESFYVGTTRARTNCYIREA